MAIFCSFYILDFWFYAQFDQFDEAKQSINVPYIIQILFVTKTPTTEMNVVFRKITTEQLI